ncbi:uncharacterized protein ATC70_007966 [Mucor velutinosus]|uniref:Uncharacterized protein n=1 Tax=Mucor velutinosus TaxID=708070 RepID=A0AAN7D2W3_9FUNG|nr:hypothetical protein ATC70_007966 [Mucor velutinosus]
MDWKILNVLEELFLIYRPTSTDCLTIFKQSFKRFASNYKSNDARLNTATKKLYDNCNKVLATDPAKLILCKQRVEQLSSLHHSFVVEEVIKDKKEALQSSSLQSTPSPTTASAQSLSKRGPDESSALNPQKKRPRRLSANYLNTLTLNVQLECLTNAYGRHNMLDFASPGLIPLRLASVVK